MRHILNLISIALIVDYFIEETHPVHLLIFAVLLANAASLTHLHSKIDLLKK